jgi:hypothetical protein
MVVTEGHAGKNGTIKIGNLSTTCYYPISPMAARDFGDEAILAC